MRYIFPPQPQPALPIADTDARFPIRRVYCVGRNYAEHTREMGGDPDREPPFFFQKNPDNLYVGDSFPYPPQTQEVHHEVELLVALSSGGVDIRKEDALSRVYGYAVCLDMTRRDLQSAAKQMRRPWEAAKAFERSAPSAPLQPAERIGHPAAGAIELSVGGALRQSGDLSQMIWTVPEIIVALSGLFALAAGDVILTGTPAGVGSVARGDLMAARIAGVGALDCMVV